MKAFFNANKFPWVTFKNYWKCSTRSELIMDVAVPFIIAVIMVLFTSKTVTLFTTLIEKFQQISGQVLTAVSILAGFNVASITIISTVQGETIARLKKEPSGEAPDINMFEQLTIYFSWAVIIQLLVALFSIILFYFSSFIPSGIENWGIPLWAWIVVFIWVGLAIHSIFISIRNMKTLYYYVNYDPPKDGGTHN